MNNNNNGQADGELIISVLTNQIGDLSKDLAFMTAQATQFKQENDKLKQEDKEFPVVEDKPSKE